MKTKTPVNKKELQNIINKLESEQTFINRNELFQAVADTDWAKGHSRPLTKSVVYLRVKEFGIQLKTPKGKKGNPNLNNTNREPKVLDSDLFKDLHGYVPSTYKNLVKRIEKGSKTAAIKLKCLDCANYQPKEVKYCTVSSCPLWPIRPYQPKDKCVIVENNCV